MGGQSGFGAVPVMDDDGQPFHADWEARVFAVATALRRRGLFTGDELRDAIERIPPEDYLVTSYYERWLRAIETILAEKRLTEEGPARDDAAQDSPAQGGPVQDDPAGAGTA